MAQNPELLQRLMKCSLRPHVKLRPETGLNFVALHLHTLTITPSEALVTRVRSALQPLEIGGGP